MLLQLFGVLLAASLDLVEDEMDVFAKILQFMKRSTASQPFIHAALRALGLAIFLQFPPSQAPYIWSIAPAVLAAVFLPFT